jgi:hypothetical protein
VIPPRPTLDEYIAAGVGAVRGYGDETADKVRGSMYDIIAGTGAILFSRQAMRDEDLLASASFAHVTSDDLTYMGDARYGIPRIMDTRGAGYARVHRPTTAAGSGTLWAGTRIVVGDGVSEPRAFEVARDTNVSAGVADIDVPIVCSQYGTGTACTVGQSAARITDQLWDNTWQVVGLTCAEGTDLEPADVYKARIRQTRLDSRRGFRTAIEKACAAAGATHTALFASDFNGTTDAGLNVVYVGDGSYNASSTLVNQCKLALLDVRCCGDHVQVLPMVATRQTIQVAVKLYDSPYLFDTVRITREVLNAVLRTTGKDGSFGYKLSSISGDIFRTVTESQDVVFTWPYVDLTLQTMYGNLANFPASLPRYFTSPPDVSILLV